MRLSKRSKTSTVGEGVSASTAKPRCETKDDQNTSVSYAGSERFRDSAGNFGSITMESREDDILDDADVVVAQQAPQSGHHATGGYNALKTFRGKIYSGMAIGGSHTWKYDPGVWKEIKEEPDLWKIDYQTTKRRTRNAPVNSGAPVGAEYHWLIVAHQHVRKLDANTYNTHLHGSKYKLAHKAASPSAWSVPTVKGQREREVELLDDAKRRVQGLPPVSSGERVKVERHERGQQKLDAMFAKAGEGADYGQAEKKRKRGEKT